MWMMGCNGDNISSSDSYQTRKLFPVIQKPTTNTSSSSYSWLALSNDDKPTSLVGEHRRCDLGSHGSSRWNPTPEQLSILEDVYRRGMRTPTAEQIQHLTAKLRRYGKIEGKNVFYWFQNHKARERQRFKRRIEAATEWLDCYLDRRGSDFAGPCGIGFAQCKDMVPTNCSTQTEESILFSREREENLWKNSLAGSDFVFQSVPFQESILFSREREENLWKNSLQFYGDNNITTYQQNPYLIFPENSSLATKSTWEESNREDQDNGEPSTIETLQLFPLHSDAISSSIKNSPTSPRLSHSQHDLIQFFQFLPLKN